MPFIDCPFIKFRPDDIERAILPIQIINPHANKIIQTIGIIDTGADECAVPAAMAAQLGHNLLSGTTKTISTGNGAATAYAHTTSFKMIHPISFKIMHTTNETPIDFMPNLHVVLLGVKSFLSDFILNIDYPQKKFSITRP